MASSNDKDTLVAQVATATPLNAAARARLVEKLSREAGHPVSLEERVAPALIGGIRVQLGDRLYDSTLATELKALRTALTSPAGGV